jgi:hypothetical protein
MNVLATILSIIALLVFFALVLAWFLPKHYAVTVSESFDRPKKAVYDYVRYLTNQVHYSKWLRADPDLRPEIHGIDGTVGAVLRWDSHNDDKNKNVGMGEQEIKKMDEDVIDVELRLIKPMAAVCKLTHHFVEKGSN